MLRAKLAFYSRPESSFIPDTFFSCKKLKSGSTKICSVDQWSPLTSNLQSLVRRPAVASLPHFCHYYFGSSSSELAAVFSTSTTSPSSRIQAISHPHQLFITECQNFLLRSSYFPDCKTLEYRLSVFSKIYNFLFLKAESTSWILFECPLQASSSTVYLLSVEFTPFTVTHFVYKERNDVSLNNWNGHLLQEGWLDKNTITRSVINRQEKELEDSWLTPVWRSGHSCAAEKGSNWTQNGTWHRLNGIIKKIIMVMNISEDELN